MTTFAIGNPQTIADIRPRSLRQTHADTGRRGPDQDESRGGRYVRAVLPAQGERMTTRELAFDATLRAAAPFQLERQERSTGGTAVRIEPPDIHRKLRRRKASTTILFVVDSSGSMGARKRMVATKGAILSLLLDAYQRRDRVGLVAFHGDRGHLLLPPTGSVEMARVQLRHLPTGGRTPLAHGLAMAHQVLKQEARRFPSALRLLVLISDGHANVPLRHGGNPTSDAFVIAAAIAHDGVLALAIDTESGPVRLNTMGKLAKALCARQVRLEHIYSTEITGLVHTTLIR